MSETINRAGGSTAKGYVVGFILSVALTGAAFLVVAIPVIESAAVATGLIMLLGAMQIVVHMICFLHLTTRAHGGWMFMALCFTALILAIMFAGSLWVMYNLSTNMMPVSPDMTKGLP
jgi:cytochrome o ubiquinol oxidase operon protein cyoD